MKTRFVATLVAALAACATRAVPEQTHNPRLPHTAWVLNVDATMSIAPEQFAKMIDALEQIVLRDVQPNDLLSLVTVQSPPVPAMTFAMPARGSRHAERQAAANAVAETKQKVISALRDIHQVSSQSDLQIPLENGLNILRGQTHATRKVYVSGGDFLTDLGGDRVTVEPPPTAPGVSALGVDVMLLLTYPTPKYLSQLHLIPAGLFHEVETRWVERLQNYSANSVTVRLVDALPPPK